MGALLRGAKLAPYCRPMRVLALLIAFVASAGRIVAQAPDTTLLPGTHLVNISDVVRDEVIKVPFGEIGAFCASVWTVDEREGKVYIAAAYAANVPVNPRCAEREAVVLVRPACVFSVSEFASRMRAPYVVLLCRPNGTNLTGVGIPIAAPASSSRISDRNE